MPYYVFFLHILTIFAPEMKLCTIMYQTKRTTIICFALLQSLVMMAQLSDPREKLGITATVDGSTNTDDRWSINCLETNNYLYYQASPKLRYALGMEIVTDKIYLRPDRKDLPRKAEISELSERFGVFADLQAAQGLSLNFGVGVTVPFYSRLRESGYNKTYMRMYDHVKPFVKLQLKYSILSR